MAAGILGIGYPLEDALRDQSQENATLEEFGEENVRLKVLPITLRLTQNTTADQQRNTRTCYKCGTRHPPLQCPAFRKTCAKCKKMNHFAKVCNSSASNNSYNKKSIEHIEQNMSLEDSSEQFFVGSINAQNYSDWIEKLTVNNGKTFSVKLDTGAQCNVIPLYIFDKLNLPRNNIRKSKARLSTYGGIPIKVVGTCNIRCETSKNLKTDIEFQVVDAIAPAVLGLPSLKRLNLLKK
ncbi:PREDICTED: uncharacterized protein LOC105451671 [Wasmannia auropunctata]|uniref:uncharacterized protein LOC105451671 n=1 Tax=Wasmannia auropunctata TaxID=64793 RepID=UPI0005EED6EC|nr:PREDICTED: uncharacterized protein LOC105451671 [Wasmannia auropunctata]